MRAREFIRENKRASMDQSHQDGIPDMVTYPHANTPYYRYRLLLAAAGSPDYKEDYSPFGPSMDEMTSVHYTDVDREIMRRAHEKMGFPPLKLSSQGAFETDHINTVSPVSNWLEKK